MSAIMKTCARCGEDKLLDAFNRSQQHRLGRQSWCRECQAASPNLNGGPRKAAWREENPDKARRQSREHNGARAVERRQFLREYKLAHGCADCGDAWQLSVGPNPDALQFDHIIPVRSRRRKDWLRWGMERLLEELKACEVRCANCHLVRTVEQLRTFVRNGRRAP